MQPLETLLAPELQQARKRRRNWLAIVGFLLMGVCVVALEYGTIYNWVQGLRSRRMAAKAEAEILGGNLEEAVNKARAAYLTKPDEPAAIRIAARVQRLTGQSGAAVQLWNQRILVGFLHATPAHHAAVAAVHRGEMALWMVLGQIHREADLRNGMNRGHHSREFPHPEFRAELKEIGFGMWRASSMGTQRDETVEEQAVVFGIPTGATGRQIRE